LRLGVYLSPADLYQIESKTGLYGDGSTYEDSVIPTDPASFKKDPTRKRKVPSDWPTFRLKTDHYNRYFMNELYELLTEYGPIHEVWFDGAHPKRKGGQTYLKEEWYSMIRKLAPEAVIFGGPDVRWCGNEHGGTRESEWNVLPVSSISKSGVDRPMTKIGDDASLLARSYKVYGKTYTPTSLMYLVSEVDTSIRNGWFWRNDHEQQVRSADEIFDIYERTAGGNAVFLLNVPPNRDGRLGVQDEKVLRETGRRIRATYDTNLAAGFTSDAQGLDDGNIETFWQPERDGDSFTIQLGAPQTINRIMLQEAITKVGQRVKKHALDAFVDGEWQEIATAGTIGYKRILRFPDVTTDRFRLRIPASRARPSIAHFSAHYHAEPPQPVQIKRNAEGQIVLETKGAPHASGSTQNILYTLDGTEPTQASKLFDHPFDLPDGGMVKARSMAAGQLGSTTVARIGRSPAGWRISASSEHAGYSAAKAIDGRADTYWHTSWADGHPGHPHTLAIDMGSTAKISGFTYLPRQDRRIPDSMVAAWRVEGSSDGKRWKTLSEGEFGNILNDPSQRVVDFKIPATIRYFRFVSLRGVDDKPYAGAAEIGLLSQTKKEP
ncbi:MAG: discoidin domain-containing protein, partial [Verrucomicrobia bacterium]|nr:discoidin domain-containing protein [Verrucomicrobiota bacterium]